jgi:hypothetical protein
MRYDRPDLEVVMSATLEERMSNLEKLWNKFLEESDKRNREQYTELHNEIHSIGELTNDHGSYMGLIDIRVTSLESQNG